MSKGTRGQADKDEVERNFQRAREAYYSLKPSDGPSYTSTPTVQSNITRKQLDFSLDETVIEKEYKTANGDSFGKSRDTTLKPIATSDGSGGSIPLTMTSNLATLKYAVEAVPFFDGSNTPLSYFIEGCEEAKAMLPAEAEAQFTKVIRTKIVGEARRTIQGQDFDSIAQLVKYLKQIYGSSKSAYQLQGELGSVYQKKDEDVITYANRVKNLGKQILETYRNPSTSTVDQIVKISLEKDMCKCFIRGLKPELEQRIARDLDVQGTVADALRVERDLRAMTELRQGSGSSNDKNLLKETCQICYKEGHTASNCRKFGQSSPPNPTQVDLGTEILICQICKKRGHSADKCRSRDPQSRRSINAIQGSTLICQLCSKSGHNAKSCRININSNQNYNTITCQWCDKQGHSAKNCWKKQNEQIQKYSRNKQTTCQICDNYGHIAKDCRAKFNQSTNNTLLCRYCKEYGHFLENCQIRIDNNRKKNEQGNFKGPSTTGAQQGAQQNKQSPKTQAKQ